MVKLTLPIVALQALVASAYVPHAGRFVVRKRAAVIQQSGLRMVIQESELDYRKRMSGDQAAIKRYEAMVAANEEEQAAKAQQEYLDGLTPAKRKVEDAKLAKAAQMSEKKAALEAAKAEKKAAAEAAMAEKKAAAAAAKAKRKEAVAAAKTKREEAAAAAKAKREEAAAAAAEKKAALAAAKAEKKGGMDSEKGVVKPTAMGKKGKVAAKAQPVAEEQAAAPKGETPARIFERVMAPIYMPPAVQKLRPDLVEKYGKKGK